MECGRRGRHQGGHLVRLRERKEYSLIKRAAAKSAVEVYEAAISPQLQGASKGLFLTDTLLCYSTPAEIKMGEGVKFIIWSNRLHS